MESPIDRARCRGMSAEELEALIRHHNERYWKESAPEISDDDFDFLTRLLAEKDPENLLLEQVNEPAVASTEEIIHRKPMLSLAKVYSLPELLEWMRKTERSPEEGFLVQAQ